MKSSDERLDELFRAVQEAPVDVQLSKVEGFVSSLPDATTLPSTREIGYSSFKIITMISLPLLALLGVYFMQSPVPVMEQTTSEENRIIAIGVDTIDPEYIASSKVDIVQLSPLEELPVLSALPNIDPIEVSDERLSISSSNLKEELSPKHDLHSKVASSKLSSAFMQPKLRPNDQQVNAHTDTTRIPEQGLMRDLSGTTPPDLNNRQMRQLKKSLYTSLFEDGLIASDTSHCKLDLLGSQIRLDGVRLNDALSEKYAKLTAIAGYGDKRAIKLSPDLILIGDFIGEDFQGSGLGLFPPAAIDTSSFDELDKSFERLEIQTRNAFGFSDDWNRLNEFAEKVLAKAPQQVGKKRLLSVDLKGPQMNILHEMLHNQLLEDQLIASKADLIVLGIGEESITLNGEVIPVNKISSYRDILRVNNIKSGAHRIIQMSDKVIGVGDFKPGQFKGSIWSVSK